MVENHIDVFKCAAVADRIGAELQRELNPAEHAEVLAALASMLACSVATDKLEAHAIGGTVCVAISRRVHALWDASQTSVNAGFMPQCEARQ